MRLFLANFRWVMLVSGFLTCSMLLGLFAPDTTLSSNFGETLEGDLAGIITRNWAALVGLVGIMLIYGAFVPAVRRFCIVVAGISKIIFIILILSLGQEYLDAGVGVAVVFDSLMVILFIVYLLLSRSYHKA